MKLRFLKCMLCMLLAVSLCSQAQDFAGEVQIKHTRCASVEMDQLLRDKYPKLGTIGQFEDWIDGEIAKGFATNSLAVTTIPVVFHVIHDNDAVGSGDNISAAYLNAQIEQLNNDFRKISGTSGDNNDPVGADTEVSWVLDTINRIDRNDMGWNAPPYSTNYVENTIKGDSFWDPNSYCNVWVVPMSGGILGYAQFPSQSGLGGLGNDEGPASTDGVVVLTSSVGSTDLPYPGGSPYNEGRTLTHELGHWLGLRHIWGDGGCSVDDYVADTPASDGANFGCPNATSCGSSDMVENYMDYTDDSYMNIFTFGQKDRIQTVLSVALRRQFGGTPPTGGDTIISDDFESGWGNWNDGGSDARRSRNDSAFAHQGTFCARIRDNTSTSVITSDAFSLSGYSSAEVSFWYIANSMENGEDFWLQASSNGGSSWTTIATYTRNGSGFSNGVFYNPTVSIPLNTTNLRFRCDASGNNDRIYLDEIVVTAE